MAFSDRHIEVTKHIRKRLAATGIKAKCSAYESCGSRWIRVSTPTCEAKFTEEQQREILLIADVLGLTFAHGLPIRLDGNCPDGAHFVLPTTCDVNYCQGIVSNRCTRREGHIGPHY